LSSSEQKLVQLAISLISNPDIIILEEPFISLDMKNEKRLIMLLQKIKEQYNKTIIFVSNNTDILYKYTNHIIITKNKKILIEGPTDEVFQRVDYLKRNKIEIPEIVEITYLAKKNKQVKIDYHKDIRDIIKDIYKHV
jgi:energy-coupling factor transporter ATP-binding protein EcfA2